MGAPIEKIHFVDCSVLEDTVQELVGMGIDVVSDVGAARWQNL